MAHEMLLAVVLFPVTLCATIPNNHASPVVAVNGNWGAFGAYGACSRSCGGGFKTRTRACNNAPSNGGAPCAGNNEERVSCNPAACPVNGNWGAFGAYSACSRSCGGGSLVRNRTCDNPAPSNGGAPCAGSNQDLVPCGTAPCNVACDDHESCGNYERYKRIYCRADDWMRTNCPKMCGLCVASEHPSVQFEHFIGACVNGSNILPVYMDQTIEECKERCKLNPECKAIEYYHNGAYNTYNKCVMQSSKDRSGCVGEDVDLYVKSPTGGWCGPFF